MQESYHIVCVCCGQGFPNGMAQTTRIRMVGKALVTGGCRFTVLNIGGGLCPNSASSGTVKGIFYEYLPGRTTRPENFFVRKYVCGHGVLQAVKRLYSLRNKEDNLCVYSWFSGGDYAWFHRYLKLIQYPIVQEVNEWWPGDRQKALRNQCISLTQGTIAISRSIINHLHNLPSYSSSHKLLHVPILVDTNEWSPRKCKYSNLNNMPYVLWCGNVSSSSDEIKFLIDVVKAVNESEMCRLVLVGKTSKETHKSICRMAGDIGLKPEFLYLPGFVSDDKLRTLMNGAVALLLPLWDTERSACRFPTKLGQYLSSESAVVATAIGDLISYLVDGKSACLVAPNSVDGFAKKIILLLRNSEWAKSIGIAGREVAKQHFSIRANQDKIVHFFKYIAKKQ